MTETSFEQRAERRSRLLGLLRSEEHWTTAGLREQLGVSQRTVMRELAELRAAGYPIESDRGRGGGIRLAGRWGIERLNLDHREVVELVLALALVESLQSPLLTGNLKAIKQKLFQAFPQEQRSAVGTIRKRIMIGETARDTIVAAYGAPAARVSASISEAFLRRNLVEIDYRSEGGEVTRRVIEAQFVLLNWPIWYIIAWDHLRASSRVFRIDRIQAARLVEGTFQMRPKDAFTGIYGPSYTTV